MSIHLTLIYIILVALASEAIIQAWMHQDGLFEEIKNQLTAWLYEHKYDKLAFLINCRLCLSYWTILILWLILLYTTWCMLIVLLATIRVAAILRKYGY